jgi:GNAT superfamily N-acetyltransferase
MAEGDLLSAERASEEIFLEADRRSRRVGEPEPEPRSPAQSDKWVERMRFCFETDPGGCWVATGDGAVIGFAISQNRENLWYLATYGVLPRHQGGGIGGRLMEAALGHANGRPGLFSSTVHPGATRRYRLAGFSLHPQMRMTGTVDRSKLPEITGLREGGPGDVEWMDRLDRDVRGAGHGPDHGFMLRNLRLVVSEPGDKPGYVYIDDRGRAHLLAASEVQTARKLLWEALAASEGDTLINCITTANEWAVDVGLAARLDIGQEGYLGVRGMQPPVPYLASGHFL